MSNQKLIKYFGFGTNKDKDMMAHMVGNPNLKGEPGKLLGYELCIQGINQIRNNTIPPFDRSPREIIRTGFGDSFKLYIVRPKTGADVHGTIWDLTEEEFELVCNWELVDFGMQEDAKAVAVNSKGEPIQIETQALLKDPSEVELVVKDEDYEAYIAPKDIMLKTADEVREDYLKKKH